MTNDMLYHFVFFHRSGVLHHFSRVFYSDSSAITWATERVRTLKTSYYDFSITGLTEIPTNK